MINKSEYAVPIEEAIARLDVIPDYDDGQGPRECVHTFLSSSFGLLGAHWGLEEVKALIAEHGVEQSGKMATGTGHGLVVVRLGDSPLFLATKRLP